MQTVPIINLNLTYVEILITIYSIADIRALLYKIFSGIRQLIQNQADQSNTRLILEQGRLVPEWGRNVSEYRVPPPFFCITVLPANNSFHLPSGWATQLQCLMNEHSILALNFTPRRNLPRNRSKPYQCTNTASSVIESYLEPSGTRHARSLAAFVQIL